MSQEIFGKLCEIIPGGVNSPFRSFQDVGGAPPVILKGQGCHIYDVNQRQFIDLCCAWGPVILGHSHISITRAVQEAVEFGPIFGAPTPWELEFATLVRQAVPSMEQIRFVNSGAEAVASALRVARGVTRRPRILKFEGGYHGHVECLDASGAEALEKGGPLALGASPGAAQETLVATYNHLESVEQLFQQFPDQIAAIILEPITGSMGVIQADIEFLRGLQGICKKYGSLLIFDEVLSGFRVSLGGAQEYFAISPDLTCLGKALAGGLPIGAYGGRREFMSQLAPLGTIYQAGTFCGNPVSMKAGIACLTELMKPGRYDRLERLTQRLMAGLSKISPELQVQGAPGMFSIHVGSSPLRNHLDLPKVDKIRFATLFQELLKRNIYLPPSCLDAACVTLAHDEDVIDGIICQFQEAWTLTQKATP